MVEVIRAFCWHQKFIPKGFSALAPGLYTCIKSLKMCIKSDFEQIILKPATYGQREKAFLLSSKFWPQWIVCPYRSYIHMVTHEKNVYKIGLYTCIKALKYIPGPGVRGAFTGPLVLWFYKSQLSFFNANTVDPDKIPHSVAFYLGLLCLPRTHLWDARH